MNEKPSEQPRKEASVELGQPSLDRQTINRVYGLFFPGAHSWREPRILIEDVVDFVKKDGWPTAVSQDEQEKFLEAALRISQEWTDEDPVARAVSDLFLSSKRSGQVAA